MSNKALTSEQRENIRRGVLRYYASAQGLKRIEELKQKVPYNKGWGVKREKRVIRPVLQYSKKNELVREWPSIAVASKELGIVFQGIWYCCNLCRKSAGKFKWSYK